MSSPAGYIGCFEVVGGRPGICLVAYATDGGVAVAYLDGLRTEEAVDPDGLITAAPNGTLTVDAELPTAGHVHIVSTGGQPAAGVSCNFCWRPTYDITSDQLDESSPTPRLRPVIRTETRDTATVGSLQLTSRGHWYHEFNSHWTGSVSGYFVAGSTSIYSG